MRKLLLVLIAIWGVLMLSCREKMPEAKLGKNSLLFEATSSSETVGVTANVEWTPECSASWVTVKGSASQLIVSVSDNTSDSARNASVTLKQRGSTSVLATLSVSQRAPEIIREIKVNKDSLSFTAAGGTENITVTSNFEWEKIDKPDWITLSPEKGSNGSTEVTVTAKESTDKSEHKGTITLGKGNRIVSIVVIQDAVPEIKAVPASLSFTAAGGTKNITVTSNFAWETIYKPAWIKLSSSEGSKGSTSATVEADPYPGKSEQTDTIKLGKGSDILSIVVCQEPVLEISVDKTSLSFPAGGGTENITVTSNFAWETIYKPEWITLSSLEGKGSTSVTVEADPYSGISEHEDTIKLGNASKAVSIIVTQAATGIIYKVKGVSFKMIPVEGGTFMMGATEQDSDADEDEKPAHSVKLSSYSIGETEVTQELWEAVMGSKPSKHSGPQRPVESVRWNDCQDFIDKLNRMTGQKFRLPTEAEWEYAARGGNKSKGYKYSGSNTVDDVAWYNDALREVKKKKPNELGIYDMSGNVGEWCQDLYGNYNSSEQTDPKGPSAGPDRRVYRGGSWFNHDKNCRVTSRSSNAPDNLNDYLGFRLAL